MSTTYYNRLIGVAGFVGAVGVTTGAFGAHFLKERLEIIHLEALKTGVLYLFIHTLAILAISILGKMDPSSRSLKTVCILFVTGIALFSGSLFLIATATLTKFPTGYIGFLTPLGGLCFIAGWITLIIYGATKKM